MRTHMVLDAHPHLLQDEGLESDPTPGVGCRETPRTKLQKKGLESSCCRAIWNETSEPGPGFVRFQARDIYVVPCSIGSEKETT